MATHGIDLVALADAATGDPDEAVPVTRRWLQQALEQLQACQRCGFVFGLPENTRV
ncbi:hypothetical protein [Alteraurantiacibacter palmitatis]|uniref:Uncharacterized protein n=1 Tax=Alteraurantiacibacter palmitatis TaxID=2054628 RepID=A0ABV7E5U7_9SPHN